LARAKRTNRTEARRRYRAQFVEDEGGSDDGDELAEAAETASSGSARRGARPTRSASGSAASASGRTPEPRAPRPGFMSSARAAYHAPNYREDLALLPKLLVHWSVLLSAALALVGTAVIVGLGGTLTGSTTDSASSGTTTVAYLGSLLVSLFVGPPPFGAALLIGFMLPRATYLVGLVFGVFAAICLSVIILVQPVDKMAGMTLQYLVYAWVFGIIGSAFFASGIAWYKRFLELLNPNRGQRGKPAAKPVQGRGNVRRNRLSS
jgi:hypothetical protein